MKHLIYAVLPLLIACAPETPQNTNNTNELDEIRQDVKRILERMDADAHSMHEYNRCQATCRLVPLGPEDSETRFKLRNECFEKCELNKPTHLISSC